MKTKIDKSRLMRRAWYLTKNQYGSFAYNLKKVWAEMKEWATEQMKEAINDLKPNYQGSINWTPSPETMAAYYNTSCYKGD